MVSNIYCWFIYKIAGSAAPCLTAKGIALRFVICANLLGSMGSMGSMGSNALNTRLGSQCNEIIPQD